MNHIILKFRRYEDASLASHHLQPPRLRHPHRADGQHGADWGGGGRIFEILEEKLSMY